VWWDDGEVVQELEPGPDGRTRLHVETRAEWRAWLEQHHEQTASIWLVSWRRATGRPSMAYEELVEEALCFGWIDSTANTLDGERSMLLLAPRKSTSGWSRPNKQRIARLEDAGLMAPAGIAVIERAKANGTWTLLDDVQDLIVPSDLAAAFAAHPGSAARFDAFPPSAKRAILEWIVQAKTDATRAKRVNETAELASRGERANQWRPRPS
jgi:uncharacterized protein YdeI (YjbR/CyaY-like superfamily)